MTDLLNPSLWAAAKALTPARLQLGRTGVSQPTSAQLGFAAAHALARDAVARPMDRDALHAQLAPLGLGMHWLSSAAPDLPSHLRRPDWGRKLNEQSRAALLAAEAPVNDGPDVVFVLGDGLSSAAIEENAGPLLATALPMLTVAGWRVAPLVVVQHARVGVGDEVAALLKAKAVVLLIGERPGLSAPVSMGAYFTWQPVVGMRDAQRNCISNIRADGLPPGDAGHSLVQSLNLARRIGATGVALQLAQANAALNIAKK